MPAHAPGELDAARGEPIASLDELRVLVDKVDAFNDPGGVAPLSDCFADLTAGGTTPTTLGAFLDKFSVEEISRRRAEVDPEYAAEQRAAQARVLVAAKRAEEAAKKEQEVGEKCLHSLFLLHSSVLLDCRRFSPSCRRRDVNRHILYAWPFPCGLFSSSYVSSSSIVSYELV